MSWVGRCRGGPVALFVAAMVVLGICGQAPGGTPDERGTRTGQASLAPPTLSPGASAALTRAEVSFATDLYGQLAKTSGNIVFSPSSVSAVLAILLLGAESRTASQLRSALHLGALSDTQVAAAATALRLQLAPLAEDPRQEVITTDELWPQQGYAVSPQFVAAVRAGWAAAVHPLDFSNPTRAASTIDAAVSAATHGIIPQLLSPQELTPPVDLVVTDAVYLHAAWAYPFDPDQTAPAPFFGTTTQQVPTMRETAQLAYARDPGYQVVELPYAGGRLEMTILLPDGTLAPLEARLEAHGLTALTTGVQSTPVALMLPRFSVSYQRTLNDDLKALGVVDAFDASAADFSGIGPDHLLLSDVVQQASVKVAEKGTVAAAATGAVAVPGAAELSRVTVSVDRPFLFAIVDRATGTPLFLGRVETPTGS
jgi:serpin B